MIRWEPIGATRATGELGRLNLQLPKFFRTGIRFNSVAITISDKFRQRRIATFSTAC